MDVPFNTHAFVKRLTSAGFAETQAEALSDAVQQAFTGGVATKADIAELRVGQRWLTGIGAGIVAILVGASGFGFDMLLDMTGDIATLQADIATVQTALAAQGADVAATKADISAIKEALQALAASQ